MPPQNASPRQHGAVVNYASALSTDGRQILMAGFAKPATDRMIGAAPEACLFITNHGALDRRHCPKVSLQFAK